MYMPSLFYPIIAAQFDLLGSVLGVVVAVVASFAIITLIASYFRFQRIVEVAEKTQPEEMGATASDVLRVQMARCLAGCARRGVTFCLALIRVDNPAVKVHMGSDLMEAIRHSARLNDISCIYDEKTGVLLFEADPLDAERILARISAYLVTACPEITAEDVRVGISSYPGHGLRGKDLIDVAEGALGETDANIPIIMPEIVDVDAEDDEEEEDDDEVVDTEECSEEESDVEKAAEAEDAVDESDEDESAEAEEEVEEEVAVADQSDKKDKESSGRRARGKSNVVDELTGVLKPSAVSAFMQRSMSELRRKKASVALFCIGVNNIEHIRRFHGEEAADDVLVAVSKILQDHVRTDDLIGRHEKYAFLVLAEATLEQAEIIGKRVSTLVQQAQIISGNKKLKTTVTLGVATYPEHGRNLHQLYQAGQKVLDHSRDNDIRAYAVYDPEIHDKVQAKPMKSIKS